ncbi:MAG: insulinase family protein, partial [Flavobacteriaceae bacterium]|nr:insulinase family protein [Flavobacteriaceae bacterium]
NYLGGGFTSRLVQKLRVEQGIIYSAGAYVSEQKSYGRSGITTATADATIIPLLKSTKEVIEKASAQVNEEAFKISRKNLKGKYLLGLESTSEFLQNLLFFDHIEKDYKEIYKFSNKLDQVTSDQMRIMLSELFNWSDQTILILGNKKLLKTLRKEGFKVIEKKYKKYL